MSMKPGDWKCPSCYEINFASRATCRKCPSVSRPSNAGPAAAVKPGDWTCSCGKNNFANRNICFGCQRPKPAPTAPTAPVAKPGDWVCPACGKNNFAGRQQCFGCRAPQAGVAQPSVAQATPAVAAQTAQQPATAVAPPNDTAAAPAFSGRPGDWSCPACSFHNFKGREVCGACRLPKGATPATDATYSSNVAKSATAPVAIVAKSATAPVAIVAQSATAPAAIVAVPGSASRPGDWPCPKCSFTNFGSRVQCMQCGAPRHPTAPPAATAVTALPEPAAQALTHFNPPTYWEGDVLNPSFQLFDAPVMADAFGILASKCGGFNVKSVQRIENVPLWHGYRAECSRLVSKHGSAKCPAIPSDWSPKTLCLLNDELGINEHYLMHGTSPAVGKLIMDGGFDPSHSGEAAGALFGQGTYFSDSLDKVSGYTKGCIIIARVALGEAAVPPLPGSTHSYRRPPQNTSGSECDCVIAQASRASGSGNNRKEFIVYRHTKAYPEFVIYH